MPKHRRLVVGSRVFKVFEYKKPFNQETSDDNPILCALYSQKRFEFYIAGERSVNVWNARSGKPTRCFKNCVDSDITYMALDKDHRKLIIGSHLGQLKVFDCLSGVMINVLEGHNEKRAGKVRQLGSDESAEISFIGYGDDDLTIITTGWDKTIKIHRDDRDEQKHAYENVMRAKEMCHRKDIISADYFHQMGLIATGGRDNNVRIWDYEKMKFESEIRAHSDEVTTVKFLKPLPLLLTADCKGIIYIWSLPIEKDWSNNCLLMFINKASVEDEVAISAVDYHHNQAKGEHFIILGDEKGMVKILDISELLKKNPKLKP